MFSLGLGLKHGGFAPWWPVGASFAADFINNRYMRDGAGIASTAAFSFARASEKCARDNANTWHSFAADTPALTDRGLLLETAETYYPCNSMLDGAAVGVVGAGSGSLPLGWSAPSWTTVEVVAIEENAGFEAIILDLTADNTSGSGTIGRGLQFGSLTTALGDFWTMGLYTELVSVLSDDTCAAASVIMQIQERTASNVFLNNTGGILNIPDTVGLETRQTKTKEVIDSNAARVQNFYTWNNIQIGEYFHRRVALKMPTATKNQSVSSPMPTTSSDNATRAADAMTLHLLAGTYDVTLTLADGSTQMLSGVSGDVVLPNALGQTIKTAVAQHV